MNTDKNTAVAAATTTTAQSNYQAAHSSDHAMPHRIALHPTSGNDWWNWCLTVNGRPAIRFRNIDRAALALTYLLDDMENGVDITTRDALHDVAAGAMTPGRTDTSEYQIVEGWN